MLLVFCQSYVADITERLTSDRVVVSCSSVMRLQLHHCPLSLWGASCGLWREAADGGDSSRGWSERRQKCGPQAALQGAQGAPSTTRHEEQWRAAVSIQQQGLIDQLLDYVHFLPPVQVQRRRSLRRPSRAGGGGIFILWGVAGRLWEVWDKRTLLSGKEKVFVWTHSLRVVFRLLVRFLFSGLLLLLRADKLLHHLILLCILFIAALQGFVDGTETWWRRQQHRLSFTGLLQLLLPLHDLLPLLQLLLLLLQLKFKFSPLLQILLFLLLCQCRLLP